VFYYTAAEFDEIFLKIRSYFEHAQNLAIAIQNNRESTNIAVVDPKKKLRRNRNGKVPEDSEFMNELNRFAKTGTDTDLVKEQEEMVKRLDQFHKDDFYLIFAK
jgi:hypothetical protein